MSARYWVRMGDMGEYEEQDDPEKAAETVAAHLLSPREYEANLSGTRLIIPGAFEGYDYISLFRGDHDAQPLRRHPALTKPEARRFSMRLLRELADSRAARYAGRV